MQEWDAVTCSSFVPSISTIKLPDFLDSSPKALFSDAEDDNISWESSSTRKSHRQPVRPPAVPPAMRATQSTLRNADAVATKLRAALSEVGTTKSALALHDYDALDSTYLSLKQVRVI
jgi:hypothetical protein